MLYVIPPVAAAAGGGIATALYRPSARLTSIVQHLAAGVVFAAAGVEVLPDVLRMNAPWVTLGGAVAGVAAMLAVQSAERVYRGAVGLVATAAIDVLIDGFVLGIAAAQGEQQGLLLSIALSLELAFLGLSVGAAVGREHPARTVWATLGVALALPVGAGVGQLLGASSPPVTVASMTFGLIALLYLVTEELLAEAHEVEDTALMPAAFFAGFIGLLLVSEWIR